MGYINKGKFKLVKLSTNAKDYNMFLKIEGSRVKIIVFFLVTYSTLRGMAAPFFSWHAPSYPFCCAVVTDSFLG